MKKNNTNATVEYTYHYHSGNSSVEGGCYTAGSHIHTASCKTSSTGVAYCIGALTGSNQYPYRCTTCGNTWYVNAEYVNPDSTIPCIYCKKYICGNTPINKWNLSCGKNNGQIESAYIVFH